MKQCLSQNGRDNKKPELAIRPIMNKKRLMSAMAKAKKKSREILKA
jgi:hypothetical protein